MTSALTGKHIPLEIFGFIPENKSEKALEQRKSRICPFNNLECTKKLYRTDEPPNGSCTVSHLGRPCIICPTRFEENDKEIIKNAAKIVLGNNKKIELVSEDTLPMKFGRIDWVGIVYDK